MLLANFRIIRKFVALLMGLLQSFCCFSALLVKKLSLVGLDTIQSNFLTFE